MAFSHLAKFSHLAVPHTTTARGRVPTVRPVVQGERPSALVLRPASPPLRGKSSPQRPDAQTTLLVVQDPRALRRRHQQRPTVPQHRRRRHRRPDLSRREPGFTATQHTRLGLWYFCSLGSHLLNYRPPHTLSP